MWALSSLSVQYWCFWHKIIKEIIDCQLSPNEPNIIPFRTTNITSTETRSLQVRINFLTLKKKHIVKKINKMEHQWNQCDGKDILEPMLSTPSTCICNFQTSVKTNLFFVNTKAKNPSISQPIFYTSWIQFGVTRLLEPIQAAIGRRPCTPWTGLPNKTHTQIHS